MRSKFLTSLLSFLILQLSVSSQTIYRLSYKAPGLADTTIYDALFIRYDNGSGIVRVNYLKPGTGTRVKAALKILENYAQLKDGTIDTGKLVYTSSAPEIIEGDSKIKITPLSFWFRLSTDNNYEPWGVSSSPDYPLSGPDQFISASFVKSTDLTKDLLLNFFTEKDDFYTNLFGLRSKGGMLTNEEKKTRIFLMVVASTKDTSLGTSPLTDSRKVVQLFADMAEFLGIRKNMVIDTIFGDRYNKKTVDSLLKKRTPSPADLFIFYYAGHGFSQKAQAKKQFPYIDLRDPLIRPRPKPETQAMNMQDIFDQVCKKGARFNLVISDCCNDEVLAKKVSGPPPPQPKGSGVKWNWNNVKALFMSKEKVALLLTAASKGELACGTDNFGGFFTHYLLSSLTTYLGPDRSNPKWVQLTGEAQLQTMLKASSLKCEQHPKILSQRGF